MELPESASLEAQVANFADEISYNAHDTDDGLLSGLLTFEKARESELFREAEEYANKQVPSGESDLLRYQVVRRLKELQVTDLLEHSNARIESIGFASSADVLAWDKKDKLIDFSDDFRPKVVGLKKMLYSKLYMHRNVRRAMEKSTPLYERDVRAFCIRGIFDARRILQAY